MDTPGRRVSLSLSGWILRARRLLAGRRLSPRARRLLGLALGLLLLPWAALGLLAALTPLPPALRDRSYAASTRVLDRQGRLLRHARAGDGAWAQRVGLGEVGPWVVPALLAAEDRRFYWHPGVDPLSIVRATAQLVWNRRIVSGASTLTQQLARQLEPRPRSFRGKVTEMALALRIEASLSKREILEEYLSRAPFGPQVRGIEAASRATFDRPAADLSLAESALLAGMPQSPTHLDPRRSLDAARRRRDQVLVRMESMGLAPRDQVTRALAEPVTLTHYHPAPLASHFLEATLAGALSPFPAGPDGRRPRPAELRTTIDAELQGEAEAAVRAAIDTLAGQHVSAAAAVVLDNETGEILAYVGSPSATDVARLGANDGVLARRQPGSSLKPFVYELAVERLDWAPTTLLPDIEMELRTPQGSFSPHNYDEHFHGPVRLREALANSYNVPAAWAASRVGPPALLERLRALGMRSLDQTPEHYGVALALGDGEIQLIELALGYMALARGGSWLPARAVREATTAGGERVVPPAAGPRQVLDPAATALITDILADDHARLSAFGEQSALDLPFPAAAKTGTSKGFRDNLAAGYTHEVTVAVWVGNFDGSGMRGVSGVTGAGPIFRDLMIAAMRGREPRPLADPAVALERVEVCALSGMLPGPACAHHRVEAFAAGKAPTEPCALHVALAVDRRNGLLAGPGCPAAQVTEEVFESYPPMYRAWAAAARRPIPPGPSPLCPGAAQAAGHEAPRLLSPPEGSTYLLDPGSAGRQELTLRAEGPGRTLDLYVDGQRHPLTGPPFLLRWPLRPGDHEAWAEAGAQRSESVHFRVE